MLGFFIGGLVFAFFGFPLKNENSRQRRFRDSFNQRHLVPYIYIHLHTRISWRYGGYSDWERDTEYGREGVTTTGERHSYESSLWRWLHLIMLN